MKQVWKITDMDILGTTGISTNPPKISARAILIDLDGNIAVMHVKKKKAYTFPGGGVEKNESITEGLKREILEETGCNCSILEEIGVVEENRAKHDFTQLSYYYLARVVGPKGKMRLTDSEIENDNIVEWYPVDIIINLIKTQLPINYQFSFIKERDSHILDHLCSDCGSVASKFHALTTICGTKGS